MIFNETTYEFAECRDMGHNWGTPRVFQTHGKESGRFITFLTQRRDCMNCPTSKDEHFVVNHTSGAVDRAPAVYTYPKGYKLPGYKPYAVAVACRYARLVSGPWGTE